METDLTITLHVRAVLPIGRESVPTEHVASALGQQLAARAAEAIHDGVLVQRIETHTELHDAVPA